VGLAAPIVIAASFAVAIVSYERLERPFLRLKIDTPERTAMPLWTRPVPDAP
jgi:peptidoglycan/LPS O-acetylase OafA/YrhL